MCVACTVQRSQKRALDPLEPEFRIVGSYHVGAKIQTWDLLEEQQVLLTTEPSLQTPILILMSALSQIVLGEGM